MYSLEVKERDLARLALVRDFSIVANSTIYIYMCICVYIEIYNALIFSLREIKEKRDGKRYLERIRYFLHYVYISIYIISI